MVEAREDDLKEGFHVSHDYLLYLLIVSRHAVEVIFSAKSEGRSTIGMTVEIRSL